MNINTGIEILIFGYRRSKKTQSGADKLTLILCNYCLKSWNLKELINRIIPFLLN